MLLERCGRSARTVCGAIAFAGVAAFGCQPSSVPPAPLRVAHESEIISLDPAAFQESATQSVLSNIFEPLVAFDRDMRIVPALATTWSTPDERTWALELRRDVRFHDGRLLSAADVKYTFERVRDDPASAMRGHLAAVSRIEIVGDHSLRLHTVSPQPLLINRIAYILIVPRPPSGPYDPERAIGTGPYRLLRWVRGEAIELEAFEDYWGPRPAIARVDFVAVSEGEGCIRALQAGEADVLRWVPETLVAQVRTIPGVRVASRPGLATYYLWPNAEPQRLSPATGVNPFHDRRVRQALSLAIDREALVRALSGHGEPAHQLVQQGIFGFVAGLPPLRRDVEAARRALSEAGFGAGFTSSLVVRDQASLLAVARELKQMVAQVGIELTIESPAWPDIVAGWRSARTPLLLVGWRFEDGDAAGFLRDCLHSRTPAGDFGSHNPGYSSERLDALIGENATLFSESKRLQQYDRLMRLAMDEMPLVPLYHKQNFFAVSQRVRWQPRLDGKLLAAEVSFSDD